MNITAEKFLSDDIIKCSNIGQWTSFNITKCVVSVTLHAQ